MAQIAVIRGIQTCVSADIPNVLLSFSLLFLLLSPFFDGTTLVPVSPATYRLCSLKFVLRPSSHLRSPDVCILDAVLTVSPNKQYRGILLPTTPATHGPRKANVPIRDQKGINK